ncbi:YfiR family protein [Microbulbifer aggregans]|uniref:YfiR family protein n=1 Tax=Microbulbifer aggregans TaxID=1769779 RepID=UPI001CFC4F59|nr:YfiR family protein [Microbulbifer aggregans]
MGASLLFLCFLILPAKALAGQVSDTDTGRQVMVDYIVHFAHHVQWPIEVFNGTGAPFRICLMGEVEVAALLIERMQHRRIQGRMVAVEKISKGEIMRARSCQIVVMGGMDHVHLAEVVTALEFFPVLTISDESRFAVLGGMIEFAGSGASMALQLNKTRLDRAELKVGNSLFRLSRQVSLEGRP